MEVKIFDLSEEKSDLKYAVIAAKYQGQWLFVRHRQRNTYEIPGGHREAGESSEETARRELYEETGTRSFNLKPIAYYSVEKENETSYGQLFYADVLEMGKLPESEIGEVVLLDELPDCLTYPLIQPILFDAVKRKVNVSRETFTSNDNDL